MTLYEMAAEGAILKIMQINHIRDMSIEDLNDRQGLRKYIQAKLRYDLIQEE